MHTTACRCVEQTANHSCVTDAPIKAVISSFCLDLRSVGHYLVMLTVRIRIAITSMKGWGNGFNSTCYCAGICQHVLYKRKCRIWSFAWWKYSRSMVCGSTIGYVTRAGSEKNWWWVISPLVQIITWYDCKLYPYFWCSFPRCYISVSWRRIIRMRSDTAHVVQLVFIYFVFVFQTKIRTHISLYNVRPRHRYY